MNGKISTTVTVSSNPAVMGGTWCIDGTRIPVETPFQLIDRVTIQPEELGEHFPSLAGMVFTQEAGPDA